MVGGELGSFLYRLLVVEDKADWSSLRWRISLGTVRRPGGRCACGSEGFAARQHVPDRLAQPAGEVDLGDLRAARFADARLRLLVAVAVGRVGAGVCGGFDQCPAQVARSLLGKRATQVALDGLVDTRVKARVARRACEG